jgi:hypothetical protein
MRTAARVRGWTLIAAAVFAPTAWGADVAYDFVACGNQKYTMLEARPDLTAIGTEQWAIVASSTTKDWESATQHCVGYWRVAEGKEASRGVCKWSDPAGNTAVGEFEQTASGEGTWVWLSGTGKYKGIKGGGRWKVVGQGRPIVEGTGQFCSHDWGRYTLP